MGQQLTVICLAPSGRVKPIRPFFFTPLVSLAKSGATTGHFSRQAPVQADFGTGQAWSFRKR